MNPALKSVVVFLALSLGSGLVAGFFSGPFRRFVHACRVVLGGYEAQRAALVRARQDLGAAHRRQDELLAAVAEASRRSDAWEAQYYHANEENKELRRKIGEPLSVESRARAPAPLPQPRDR